MKLPTATLFALTLLSTAGFASVAHAQQSFAKDLRGDGASARIATLPTEPGKLETYFVNVKDGDVLRSPFRVVFGVIGLGVSPAGIKKPGTGHHHLLIDTPMPYDVKKAIPSSPKYLHFGGGQTEALLDLPPGPHTLQLLFADDSHVPVYTTKSGAEIVVHSRKVNIVIEAPSSPIALRQEPVMNSRRGAQTATTGSKVF